MHQRLGGTSVTGVSVPQFSEIRRAHLQFEAEDIRSVATSLTIEGEAVDNAATFVGVSGNISSRPRTAASVSWMVPPWLTYIDEVDPIDPVKEGKRLASEWLERHKGAKPKMLPDAAPEVLKQIDAERNRQ